MSFYAQPDNSGQITVLHLLTQQSLFNDDHMSAGWTLWVLQPKSQRGFVPGSYMLYRQSVTARSVLKPGERKKKLRVDYAFREQTGQPCLTRPFH
jgi:hypothetical protein